jgi:trans-aconitate 2-methyltransferase
MTNPLWDPGQYLLYSDERSRPFFDLVSQVEVGLGRLPRTAADLGCGAGNLTAALARRWPAAHIWGVDSSPEMIAKAQAHAEPPRLVFVQSELQAWQPPAELDVILSNAALHWLPDHATLLPALVAKLAPGGWLAFQVPGEFEGRRIFREVTGRPRWRDLIGDKSGPPTIMPGVGWYVDFLAPLGFAVNAWETVYYHILQGENAVLEWVKGTMLRPALVALAPPEQQELLAELNLELLAAYPPRSYGTVLPFRRLFVIARHAQ